MLRCSPSNVCRVVEQDLDTRLRELEEKKMDTQKVIMTGQIYDFMRKRLMVRRACAVAAAVVVLGRYGFCTVTELSLTTA